MTINDLVAKVRHYDPALEPGFLEGVYAVAEGAHAGQLRASGEGYIAHPLAVADNLADLEMDRATIAAALLHDVVEDTSVPSGLAVRSPVLWMGSPS
jgi:GTP diphosphokinase / guanosine-3',5'-bis(diphosphate) 3'-diphosphatase